MVGVILAGGENRRMPEPKAFLRVGATTIIERLLSLHRGLTNRVLIVTRDPGSYAGFPAELIGDVYPIRGPMTGIVSALLNAGGEPVLVTACDMPFLERAWVQKLIEGSADYDITVSEGPDGVEPLVGVYGPAALPRMEAALQKNVRGIQECMATFPSDRIRRVTTGELGMDRETARRAFVNINTMKEYEQITGGLR